MLHCFGCHVLLIVGISIVPCLDVTLSLVGMARLLSMCIYNVSSVIIMHLDVVGKRGYAQNSQFEELAWSIWVSFQFPSLPIFVRTDIQTDK